MNTAAESEKSLEMERLFLSLKKAMLEAKTPSMLYTMKRANGHRWQGLAIDWLNLVDFKSSSAT